MKSVKQQRETVESLRSKLEAAEANLKTAEASKTSDPITYLAKLIYNNKVASGSYGYEYSDFGSTEIERAHKVLETANGDVHIAEAFISKFHLR